MRSIRYTLHRPVSPLVRFYLKSQRRRHMDYSFRFIMNEELEQASAHWKTAELFRMAADSLAANKTRQTPPSHQAPARILIRERRVIKL